MLVSVPQIAPSVLRDEMFHACCKRLRGMKCLRIIIGITKIFLQ